MMVIKPKYVGAILILMWTLIILWKHFSCASVGNKNFDSSPRVQLLKISVCFEKWFWQLQRIMNYLQQKEPAASSKCIQNAPSSCTTPVCFSRVFALMPPCQFIPFLNLCSLILVYNYCYYYIAKLLFLIGIWFLFTTFYLHSLFHENN